MKNSRSPRTIFSSGVIIILVLALVAATAFAWFATSDKVGGLILIAGFALIGIIALLRMVQRSEQDDQELDRTNEPNRAFLGREGFGGPGRPDALLRSLVILQGAVLVISVLSGFDVRALVFLLFFAAEDLSLLVLAQAISRKNGR